MTALRRTQLVRLGAWISLATVALIVVIFVARTESGIRRIAMLLSPPEAARTSKAPQIASRPSDVRPASFNTSSAERSSIGMSRPACSDQSMVEDGSAT